MTQTQYKVSEIISTIEYLKKKIEDKEVSSEFHFDSIVAQINKLEVHNHKWQKDFQNYFENRNKKWHENFTERFKTIIIKLEDALKKDFEEKYKEILERMEERIKKLEEKL